MASAELNLGLGNSSRTSSRVLKPPGGGSSNIFGEGELKPNPPRPKYDQQNSSNLNFVMNTTDPNEAVVKTRSELEKARQAEENAKRGIFEDGSTSTNGDAKDTKGEEKFAGRTRVPPGGFSAGFW